MSRIFSCDLCKYETIESGNFKKHLKSKKHKRKLACNPDISIKYTPQGNIKKITLNTQYDFKTVGITDKTSKTKAKVKTKPKTKSKNKSSPKAKTSTDDNNKKNYTNIHSKTCEYCNQDFPSVRIKRTHCEKCPFRNVMRQIDVIKQTSDTKDKIIEHYQQKSVGMYNYINTNYQGAKHLKKLPYSKFKSRRQILYIDEKRNINKNDNIVEDAIHAYKHDVLDSYIGDVVYGTYESSDPEKQQIWVTDVVRLKFILRRKRKDGALYWYKDTGGECAIEILIDPTLRKLKNLIRVYQKNYDRVEMKKCDSYSKQEKFMRENEIMIKITTEIENRKLHKKVLRYIAPKFVPHESYIVPDGISNDGEDEDQVMEVEILTK